MPIRLIGPAHLGLRQPGRKREDHRDYGLLAQAAIALRLRHIFVVLPYTNIVQQSVDVYRKALVLPGENPEKIVAAHHHQAEFKSADLRFLTTLWDAPIIVTTAVQFFETLGVCPSIRNSRALTTITGSNGVHHPQHVTHKMISRTDS